MRAEFAAWPGRPAVTLTSLLPSQEARTEKHSRPSTAWALSWGRGALALSLPDTASQIDSRYPRGLGRKPFVFVCVPWIGSLCVCGVWCGGTRNGSSRSVMLIDLGAVGLVQGSSGPCGGCYVRHSWRRCEGFGGAAIGALLHEIGDCGAEGDWEIQNIIAGVFLHGRGWC